MSHSAGGVDVDIAAALIMSGEDIDVNTPSDCGSIFFQYDWPLSLHECVIFLIIFSYPCNHI